MDSRFDCSHAGGRRGGLMLLNEFRRNSGNASAFSAISFCASFLILAFAAGTLFVSTQLLSAQDMHRQKLPGLDKITSNGPTRQAFTGKIQSVDRKHEVLSVNTIEGVDTEIFPLKKKVKVTSANGLKLKLAALKPGASVTVFYEQRGDHRTISQIIVLSDVVPSSKKQEHHPS